MLTSQASRTMHRLELASADPTFFPKMRDLAAKKIGREDEEGRRSALREMLQCVGILTADEAWTIGHMLGFYTGGEGSLAKDDLAAVGRRHRGFWRFHSFDPDREKAKRWADYWTPRRSG